MKRGSPYTRYLWWLIIISTLIRGLLAAFLELGNDEVYYWTYALYPALSHFDHPPMVGWVIQLFTLNLLLDSEFFIRLGPVIIGSLNTLLVFLIGRSIKNERTGWIASLLYTSSIYTFVISGTFILPDTPQLFYWLISTYFLIEVFNGSGTLKVRNWQLVLAGMGIGLAMLSKYTSVFLWIGAILYILLYDRKWIRSPFLYFSILLSGLFFLPVLIWNINTDFVSFTFHSGRVGFFGSGINFNTLITELSGQFLYNNPVNYVLIAGGVIAFLRKKVFFSRSTGRFLLLTALPLIFLFILFSLFRQTLPHWTGPAYTMLIFLASAWLSDKQMRPGMKKPVPLPVLSALSLLVIILILGVAQIKGGWLFYDYSEDPRELGKNDVTLDMYGWEQIGEEFNEIRERDINEYLMRRDDVVLSYRWFPAANLDYYVAGPAGTEVLCIGPLDKLHKYAWINRYRGGFEKGMNAWFITTTRDYHDVSNFMEYFHVMEPSDTIRINRGGRHVKNAFVYRMYFMKKVPESSF